MPLFVNVFVARKAMRQHWACFGLSLICLCCAFLKAIGVLFGGFGDVCLSEPFVLVSIYICAGASASALQYVRLQADKQHVGLV